MNIIKKPGLQLVGFFVLLQLKGLSEKEAAAECKKMTEVLKFTAKCNSLSSELSGGMKRKLSVGIALSGGSKVCEATRD